MNTSAEHDNHQFYEALYRGHRPLGHLLRARLSFDQQSKARPNIAFLEPFIRAHCREPVRVLDYGCGWGSLLLGLPRGWRLYGYDIADSALSGLERVMPLVGRRFERVALDDAGAIEPGGFELVICSHVLEHVPDDAEVLRQLHRGMAAGGTLLVNVPIHEWAPDPRHVRAYTPESLAGALRDTGFEIQRSVEMHRISGWVRSLEIRRGRWVSRPLRLLLSLLPYVAWRWMERIFLSHLPTQHLLVLATRPA